MASDYSTLPIATSLDQGDSLLVNKGTNLAQVPVPIAASLLDVYQNNSTIYNAYSYNVPYYRASLARTKNNSAATGTVGNSASADTVLVILGASQLQGAYAVGSFGNGGSQSRGDGSRSFSGQLAKEFNRVGIPASNDNIIGCGVAGFDTRVTPGAWAGSKFGTNFFIPGNTGFISTDTSNITYATTVPWDTVDIFYFTVGAGQTLTPTAGSSTAGSAIALTNSANVWQKATYTRPQNDTLAAATLVAGSQYVTVTSTAKACVGQTIVDTTTPTALQTGTTVQAIISATQLYLSLPAVTSKAASETLTLSGAGISTFKLAANAAGVKLLGVSFRNSTKGQVLILNIASSGSTYDNWNATSGAPYFMNNFLQGLVLPVSTGGGLGVYPSLVIMGSGINEGGAGVNNTPESLANVTSQFTNLINFWKTTGNGTCDVMATNETPIGNDGGADYLAQLTYNNMFAQVSKQMGIFYCDLWRRWGQNPPFSYGYNMETSPAIGYSNGTIDNGHCTGEGQADWVKASANFLLNC